MYHPFYSNKTYLKYYLIVWAIIAVLNAIVEYKAYGLDIQFALIDSFVFNFIFAVLGFGLWYTIRYGVFGKLSFASSIVNYIVSATVLVGLLLFISNNSLALFISNENYITFLDKSLLFRLISGVLFFTLLVLFYYLVVYYRNIQEKTKNENKLNLLIKEAELKSLKTQINPHFLFNSLNSINALTISDTEKAQQMIFKLSEFLRYSVRSHKSEFNTLSEEIENVEKYLDIEVVRFGDKLKFTKIIEKECADIKVPFLILQPLIENAVKYSIGQTGEESLISLSCILESKNCVITINNNYNKLYTTDTGEGVGLNNIKKRLELIYGTNFKMDINSDNKTFNIKITLPLKTNTEI